MLRNAVFLLGGNVAGWAIGLVFLLVVPRFIGPTAWGEFSLGMAIAGLGFSFGGLGIAAFLVKQIARDRQNASAYLGAGLATHAALSAPIVIAVLAFTTLAHYSAHTRAVVLLATGISLCAFIAAPAVSALQALELMHLNSIVAGLRTLVASSAAILVAVIFRADVVVLILVVLAFNVLAVFLQVAVTRRHVSVGLRFDGGWSRRLIVSGLPFWSNGVLLTVYAWIDSILLSVLVSTREVGFYAAPIQVIATVGFLPALVTTVVFPALASSFFTDFQRMRRITRTSLTVLISFGLPISIGAALVGPSAIRFLFGSAYRPSSSTMMVLALTIVPGYIATLAYWALAAADQQRKWAYVMGVMAVVNPLINLITIPYFQFRFGHGSLGAAVALLITDTVVCIVGLVLVPRACLKPAGPLLSMTARAAAATLIMAIPVWFLRERFLPVPVLVGAGVFGVSALTLGVFRSEGFEEVWLALTGQLQNRIFRRSEVKVPV